MKKLLPLHILIIFLALLALGSSFAWNGTDITSWILSLRTLLLLSIASFLVRLLIRLIIDPAYKVRSEHRIITMLILFLLFDPLLPWWVFAALGATTELFQYFLRSPMGPLFNPAALGGLILSLFGYLPSWWGVNPPPRFLLAGIDISILAWIVAAGAAYVVYRYRKLSIAGSALLAIGLSYALLFQENPTYLLLEGTLLFFVFVMASEPKTSPVVRHEQIIYGLLIGTLFSFGLYFHFIEASFIALLLGNLYAGRRFLASSFSALFAKPAPEKLA